MMLQSTSRMRAHLIKALTQQCISVKQSLSLPFFLMPPLQLLPLTCDIMTLYCNLINCEPSWLYLVLLLQQLGCYMHRALLVQSAKINRKHPSTAISLRLSRVWELTMLLNLNSVVCLEKTKQIGPVLYVLLSKVQIMVLKLFLCHYVHYVWVQFWLIVRVLVWAFMLTQTKLHCLRLLSGGPASGCKRKSKDSTNVLVLV